MPRTAVCQRIVVGAGGVDPGGIRAGLARFEVQSHSEKTGGIGSVRKTISVLLPEDNPADAGLVQETSKNKESKVSVRASGPRKVMKINPSLR
jgi:hypothetical protein